MKNKSFTNEFVILHDSNFEQKNVGKNYILQSDKKIRFSTFTPCLQIELHSYTSILLDY